MILWKNRLISREIMINSSLDSKKTPPIHTKFNLIHYINKVKNSAVCFAGWCLEKKIFYRQKIEKQDKVMLMWYIYFTVDDLCEGGGK